MKHTTLCLLRLPALLLLCVGVSSGQWIWQNPQPCGTPLNDVAFVDANIGTAVGDYGTILRTTNAGETWVVQSSGKTYTLNALSFVDANTGTAVGFDVDSDSSSNPFVGIILRTTNGGNTWIEQTSGVRCILDGVHFSDADTGTVVGGGTGFGGGHGTILRTTDGGENWLNQLSDTTNSRFRGVCFTDANTGTVVGEGDWIPQLQSCENTILRTTNGGKDWVHQTSDMIGSLHDVWFVDAMRGIAVGGDGYVNEKGIILRTTDGGNTWTGQSVDSTNGIYDLSFSSATIGTAVGNVWLGTGGLYSECVVLKTTDGGTSWERHSTGIRTRNGAISFTDSITGTLVVKGEGAGTIFRTTNGAKTWVSRTKRTTDDWLRGVSFKDAHTGTAVGSGGTILRTTNGGNNWLIQESTGHDLRGLCFADANTGIAVGYGVSLRTTGGGSQWETNALDGVLYGVHLADALNGWAVGALGKIIHTTDGGAHWIDQSRSAAEYFSGVFFNDADNGTVVGGHGTILKTTDGGNSWRVKSSGTANDLCYVHFTDANNGTAVGLHGTILRTTNGGDMWVSQASGTDNLLLGVSFTDPNNGTIVGSGGTMLRTTDGGNTWVLQHICNSELAGVCFTDAQTGWAVGDEGTILHTTNGGVTFIEGGRASAVTTGYLLSQNYPNPFNPETVVSGQWTVDSRVRLVVYDVVGRKIAVLADGRYPAGRYSFTFDGTSIASGIYFYRLTAGDFAATKSMILLK